MRIHKFADVILKVVEETTCEKPQQTFRKTKIDLTKILQHIMTSHVLFKPAASFECICCPAVARHDVQNKSVAPHFRPLVCICRTTWLLLSVRSFSLDILAHLM